MKNVPSSVVFTAQDKDVRRCVLALNALRTLSLPPQ